MKQQISFDAFLKDNLDLDDEPSELDDIDEGFNSSVPSFDQKHSDLKG